MKPLININLYIVMIRFFLYFGKIKKVTTKKIILFSMLFVLVCLSVADYMRGYEEVDSIFES